MSEAIVNSLYETDFYRWTQAQADALRRGALNEIDWENVAEEIESLGRSEKKEIRSRLMVLLAHLVKWKYQPTNQCPSWRASIREARNEIGLILDDNPSLRAFPAEAMAKAYERGLASARDETGIADLPEACPWTIDQVLDADFLP
jgi:Domain of unknown function DUF29